MNAIDKEPDLHIGNRRIWEVKYKIVADDRPDWSACLRRWILNLPDAHPAWSWFVADVIHLREIKDVKSANRQYPEAEHELMIMALHPDWKPTLEPRGLRLADGSAAWLEPMDCEFQFDGLGDEGAVRLCNRVMQAIADGRLTPDSDRREHFHGHLKQLVDHMKGKHGPVA